MADREFPQAFVKRDPRTGTTDRRIATSPAAAVRLRFDGWLPERVQTAAAAPTPPAGRPAGKNTADRKES